MKLTINQEVLKKYNLNLGEFLTLLLTYKSYNVKDCMNGLVDKGLAGNNMFDEFEIVITDGVKRLVSDILIESDETVVDRDKEFEDLAVKMKELYPSGRKEGTTYMWRGTTAEIAKKLKTLVVKYHFDFTEEQLLSATRKYVESFNGNYRFMKLLKYFILKAEKDADGNINVTSELMSLIENKGQNDLNNDWVAELR